MLIFKEVNVLKGDLELTRTLEAIKALEVGSLLEVGRSKANFLV